MIKSSGESRKLYADKGFTVWLTGLPCAGKSTLAEILATWFRKSGLRVELLDGDKVRAQLSPDLGFSKEDRDLHVLRLGFIAHLLSRNGIIAIAAAISPYRHTRDRNRCLIGDFVEVFVKAPVEICEQRDIKGLYKKAKAGRIKGFTGVDDPYEEPLAPEVICQTDRESPEESFMKVRDRLFQMGYLKVL